MSYCQFVKNANETKRVIHETYHDREYGFPIYDDNLLFERLVLEINQAGLSWETILKKKEGFQLAYHNFSVAKVASFREEDIQELLTNSGIIRNKLKVHAAIFNANSILALSKEHGSFYNWLKINHPLTLDQWVKLFKKHFKFVGNEIVNEFLMSIGVLKGAHDEDCPVFKEILLEEPLWSWSL